ncbi:MAG: type III pantothenate kinase [Spiroplasma sp.]|nr:type III pantothenate kinase [Spiroplasma sp.]
MILLIDIGNSLTKIALGDEITQKITLLKPIISKEKNWNNNIKKLILQIKNKVNKTIISTVIPDKLTEITKIITTILKTKPIILNGNLIKNLPIKVNTGTKEIGSDLIALAIGSYHKYQSSIIVSLGTATTYTIIKDNVILGIIIGPGFNDAKNSLTANAALIKPFTIKPYQSVLGNTTNHALSIGYGNGFNYMIDTTITAINNELKSNLPVIITGGNFQELKPFFHFKYQYDQDILILGLMIIYQMQEKNNKLN